MGARGTIFGTTYGGCTCMRGRPFLLLASLSPLLFATCPWSSKESFHLSVVLPERPL